MANVELLSLSDTDRWSEYLQKLPIDQQDIYFTPEYYHLHEELGDGKAHCFVFEQSGDLALYPFLINSVNNLGFDLNKEFFDIQGAYGYNGVACSSYDAGFVDSFYTAFAAWCRDENIIAEFTRFHPLLRNQRFSAEYLDIVFDRKTVFVNLEQSYSEIFSHYQHTTKRQIKRATNRNNLTMRRFDNNAEILKAFWYIYNETMDRAAAIPYLYFNKDYFRQLLQTTSNSCFVAYSDDVAVAAIIAFYNSTYVHGHLGGALTNYLKMSPYSFLYDQIIQFGMDKGCKYYHVGGGRTNNPDDALLNFKLNFSQDMLDFFIGKKIWNPAVYEMIIEQWEKSNPEKREKYAHHLLKYRY
jgi:hypothetical protein